MHFTFKNSSRLFSSQDPIKGWFIYDTKNSTNLSWISVELIGSLSVSFFLRQKISRFSSSEIFTNQKLCVWRQNSVNEKLAPGIHKFQFQFLLPSDSLPSFASSSNGKILYIIKAKICNLKGAIKDYETAIKIYKPLNILEMPILLHPQNISNLDLSIKPKISVTHSVFVIGQQIPLLIELENSSYEVITKIVFGLKTTEVFKGKTKELPFKEAEKRSEKIIFTNKSFFNVSQNSHDFLEAKISTANAKNETINDSCIKINYSLFVKFYTKQKKLCSELSLPITLVKSFLKIPNSPPPPYYSATDNEIQDLNCLCFEPPPYIS